MSATLSPATILFWIVLVIGAIVVAIWTISEGVKRLRGRQAPAMAPDKSKELLAKLEHANTVLSAAVMAEQRAIATLAALPETIAPAEADKALRQAMPGADIFNRYALLLHAWRNQQHPQALAAMAGMALADPTGTYGLLDICLHTAIEDGGPALLDGIAAELEPRTAELDHWLRSAGLILRLEDAADRIAEQSPDVAARLRRLATQLEPRTRALMLKRLRFEIERIAEADPSTFDVPPDVPAAVRALAPACMPRYPELLDGALAALGRQTGAEWRIAEGELIGAVIDRFRQDRFAGTLPLDRMLDRLCDGIMAPDPAVSRAIAGIAANLLGDYVFDAPDHRARLQAALSWAVGAHPPDNHYDWLGEELDPPDLSANKLREIEAGIERHAEFGDKLTTLAETTAAIDPEVALAELRHLLPTAPVDPLRGALEMRWDQTRNPVLLVALVGLALETCDAAPVDGRMIQLCLQKPFAHGKSGIVGAAAALLSDRLDRLDDWIVREPSVIDLRAAAARFADDQDLGRQLDTLLSRVMARRVVLLGDLISARLAAARQQADDSASVQLALGLHKFCLPGEPTLAPPVHAFMRERRESAAWREALLHLETMTVMHFGAQDQLARYDFDPLLRLLIEGIGDGDRAVSALAANCAARLVDKGFLGRPTDLTALGVALDGVAPADPAPESFTALRAALAARQT